MQNGYCVAAVWAEAGPDISNPLAASNAKKILRIITPKPNFTRSVFLSSVWNAVWSVYAETANQRGKKIIDDEKSLQASTSLTLESSSLRKETAPL
jgi:hypothetical protein